MPSKMFWALCERSRPATFQRDLHFLWVICNRAYVLWKQRECFEFPAERVAVRRVRRARHARLTGDEIIISCIGGRAHADQ